MLQLVVLSDLRILSWLPSGGLPLQPVVGTSDITDME